MMDAQMKIVAWNVSNKVWGINFELKEDALEFLANKSPTVFPDPPSPVYAVPKQENRSLKEK